MAADLSDGSPTIEVISEWGSMGSPGMLSISSPTLAGASFTSPRSRALFEMSPSASTSYTMLSDSPASRFNPASPAGSRSVLSPKGTGRLQVDVVEVRDFPFPAASSPYVLLKLGTATRRTSSVRNQYVWNESVSFPSCDKHVMEVALHDENAPGSDALGYGQLHVPHPVSQKLTLWVPMSRHGQEVGALCLTLSPTGGGGGDSLGRTFGAAQRAAFDSPPVKTVTPSEHTAVARPSRSPQSVQPNPHRRLSHENPRLTSSRLRAFDPFVADIEYTRPDERDFSTPIAESIIDDDEFDHVPVRYSRLKGKHPPTSQQPPWPASRAASDVRTAPLAPAAPLLAHPPPPPSPPPEIPGEQEFTLDQAVVQMIQGDQFYKWRTDRKSVVPRWFWLDFNRGTLAWGDAIGAGPNGQQNYALQGEVLLRDCLNILSDVTPNPSGDFYNIMVVFTTQEVLISTQLAEKYKLWFFGLTKLTAPYRSRNNNLASYVRNVD